MSFGFVVVLTYDDNSTQAITLEPESEIVVTAPSSRYITHMKAGIKTVEIPMDPSTQTGWDIPDTPLGTTVYANYRGFLGTFIDPEQGCVVTFSSELL